MDFGYVAVETFLPTEKYTAWSKLYQIKEIVSLDCALCPSIQNEFQVDNNRYLPGDGFYNDILDDLDALLSIVKDKKDIQILAVMKEPDEECCMVNMGDRFKFYGYDLLEDFSRISALTNCGGFDKAFSANDISEYGLMKEFNKAKHIQSLLRREYPDEEHADCSLWAIWRMEKNDNT